MMQGRTNEERRPERGLSSRQPIPSEKLGDMNSCLKGLRIDLNLGGIDNQSVGVGVHPKPPSWANDSYEGSLNGGAVDVPVRDSPAERSVQALELRIGSACAFDR